MSLDVSLIISEEEVYTSNITHNLGKMAKEAGIYEALWRPEEIEKTQASEITELLEKGLADLTARPEHFKQFNPENGWGKYETLVEFVTEYLQACMEYPDATILISR